MTTAAQRAAKAVADKLDEVADPQPLIVEGPGPDAPARNVVEAWNRVLRDMPAIGKDNRMTQGGGYNYRSIEQFTAHASVLMAKHGVIVIPNGSSIEYVEVGKTSGGNVVIEARGKWDWAIYGPGGIDDVIFASSFGQGRDSSDKAANKAATAAFKYLLMPALMISDSKEDPDHDRIEVAPEPEPDPAKVERMARYSAVMDRAQALKKAGASIDSLRAVATAAGFDTVNAWGKANVDEFEEAVGLLEEEFKQRSSGEPEQEGE